ncbi:hypothetical protein HRbin30_03169 [bacterium HR30]|nr:hypothetical protein HRbin30_03169 [bacterium HR30]
MSAELTIPPESRDTHPLSGTHFLVHQVGEFIVRLVLIRGVFPGTVRKSVCLAQYPACDGYPKHLFARATTLVDLTNHGTTGQHLLVRRRLAEPRHAKVFVAG